MASDFTHLPQTRKLLMSIPAEDRSVNLHNIESVVGSNMNEKALGVEWSIDTGWQTGTAGHL